MSNSLDSGKALCFILPDPFPNCLQSLSADNTSRQRVKELPEFLNNHVFLPLKNIRIYHECVSRIEKSVPRITVWHQKACRVMTNGDHKGHIFLSYFHPNSGLFFLLTIRYHILFWRKGSQKFQNKPRCDML